MFSLVKKDTDIWCGQFSSFPEAVAVHAVSTRFGGVSEGAYASLNLALHVGDDSTRVVENRRRFCRALGLAPGAICTAEQVHGERIARVTRAEAGRGSQIYAEALPATDTLMTNEPGVPLMLFFADCTPILLLDPVHRAAALAHGGWKGTVRSIAAKTVAAMQAAYGTRPEDCLAAIGPAIGPCCYEVGPEVAAQFRTAFPAFAGEILAEREGHIHLDLWQANRRQLESAGLLPEHIEAAETCTACNSDVFFSYRADQGTTGRIAAVIALK